MCLERNETTRLSRPPTPGSPQGPPLSLRPIPPQARPSPSPAATPLVRPQVWCGSYRPEFAIQSIKTDVHSPLKYRQVAPASSPRAAPLPPPRAPREAGQAPLVALRVLGSLQNLGAFADAFHCAEGTHMHPHERCRVW